MPRPTTGLKNRSQAAGQARRASRAAVATAELTRQWLNKRKNEIKDLRRLLELEGPPIQIDAVLRTATPDIYYQLDDNIDLIVRKPDASGWLLYTHTKQGIGSTPKVRFASLTDFQEATLSLVGNARDGLDEFGFTVVAEEDLDQWVADGNV